MSLRSTSPIRILPLSMFQKPAINFAIVDFPPPESPTIAVSSFSFALNEILFNTFLDSSYANDTF